MTVRSRWAWTTSFALIGAAISGYLGDATLALVFLSVAVFGFIATVLARRVEFEDDDAAYRIALEGLQSLLDDVKKRKRPDLLWLQAEANLRRLVDLRDRSDAADRASAQKTVADLIHLCFNDARARRRLNYAVVERMLDACAAAADLEDVADGPLHSSLQSRLWVEMNGVPLSQRVQVLRGGIPENAAARAKGFDAPVFKRRVRDAS